MIVSFSNHELFDVFTGVNVYNILRVGRMTVHISAENGCSGVRIGPQPKTGSFTHQQIGSQRLSWKKTKYTWSSNRAALTIGASKLFKFLWRISSYCSFFLWNILNFLYLIFSYLFFASKIFLIVGVLHESFSWQKLFAKMCKNWV